MFKERLFASNLLIEISEKNAEKISGGASYTLQNKCDKPINVLFDGKFSQLLPLSQKTFSSSLNKAFLGYDQKIGAGYDPVALVIDPGIGVFDCMGSQVIFVASGSGQIPPSD